MIVSLVYWVISALKSAGIKLVWFKDSKKREKVLQKSIMKERLDLIKLLMKNLIKSQKLIILRLNLKVMVINDLFLIFDIFMFI